MQVIGRCTRVAALTLALGLAACVGSPAASPTTTPFDPLPTTASSVSGAASSSPTSASESSPTPEPTARIPGAVAAVVTTDLVVRTKPGTGSDSEILQPYLDAPQQLYILDGPVPANGYDWYLVAPLFPDYLPHGYPDPPSGWVAAAGKDGEAWIAASTLDCPRADLFAIMTMSGLARLACFGERELTLKGTLSGCAHYDPGAVDPTWLASEFCSLQPDDYDPVSVPYPGPLEIHSEQIAIPFEGRVTVTGHFDDPVASSCQSIPGATEFDPPAPDFVVLTCRAQFVVSDIKLR